MMARGESEGTHGGGGSGEEGAQPPPPQHKNEIFFAPLLIDIVLLLICWGCKPFLISNLLLLSAGVGSRVSACYCWSVLLCFNC